MGDPTAEILKGVYTLLNGNITYNNKEYKYYPIVKPDEKGDYVHLESIELDQAEAKDFPIWNGSFGIEVVTKAYNNHSYELVNALSDKVANLLTHQKLTMTGYTNFIPPFQVGFNTFLEETETNIIIRKLLLFNLSVQED